MPIKSDPKRQGFTKLDNNMFPGHTRACRLLLIAISTHEDSYIPTHRQLASQTGYTMRTVIRTIKKLEDLGEIFPGKKGPNRTQKWHLNKASVMTPCHNKLRHHVTTKKTKEKDSARPKPKAKIKDPLPDWESSPKQASKSDIVFWAQELEPYFFTFINYRRLNDWLARIAALHGPDAWKSVVRHFENLRREVGDPDKQWVFSYRNLSLLERQVNFGAKLRII